LGIVTIGDLRRLAPETLAQHFGSQGEHFWKLAHGIDERPVVPDREAKSISHETTFPVDHHDRETLRAWVLELAEHVGRRLRRQQVRGRTIQLKLRFADFRTITRAVTLPHPTDVTHEISQAATGLLEVSLPQAPIGIRLVGVGISQLAAAGPAQRSLFVEQDAQKHRQLEAALDELQSRFGNAALTRGSGLLHNAQHRPAPRPKSESS
jgi:DNA polymerase-4